MYLDITGTFRDINSPVKFTTGFVYMGPRLGAGLVRTQTSQSVTGGGIDRKLVWWCPRSNEVGIRAGSPLVCR